MEPQTQPKEQLEEGLSVNLQWQSSPDLAWHLPVVLQHFATREVLFVATLTPESLALSLAKKKAVLWSRSRSKIWVKGESSGDFLHLQEVRVNCEQNSLLFLVLPEKTGVCHTSDRYGKRPTCYYRRLVEPEVGAIKTPSNTSTTSPSQPPTTPSLPSVNSPNTSITPPSASSNYEPPLLEFVPLKPR